MFIKKNDTHIKSNRRISIIFFFLFLNFVISCKEKDIINNEKKENPKEIGIVIIDKTVMRLDPIIYSSVVTYIDKGEKVIITKRSREKTWLGDDEDYWYEARFSSGFTGWIYGKNIKIFSENESNEIKKFLSKFWAKEYTRFKIRLIGIWRSIRTESKYPDQYLVIYDNGRYKSYLEESDVIEGKYSLNYKKSEIIFQNGTYFGTRIDFLIRENRYYLVKKTKDMEIQFKKISTKVDDMAIHKVEDRERISPSVTGE